MPSFPDQAIKYWEWYVPIDENHYIYFQVNAWQRKNPLQNLWRNIHWYLWDKIMGPVVFNNQDAAMVAQTTKYVNRTGNTKYLSKLARQDEIHYEWRKYCNDWARGVGTKWLEEQQAKSQAGKAPELAIAGGSEEAEPKQ